MRREEIDEKFKWDLSKIYPSMEEYNKDFNIVKNEIPKLEEYKGKFLDSVEIFLEFMEIYEKVSRKLSKLSMYSHLAVDVEPGNEEIQTLEANISGLSNEYSNSIVFMELEIGKNEEKAKKILGDERCKKYTNMINSILRYNPHRLSDETEEVINMAGNAMTAYNTYKSIKLEYEPVIIDGKEYFLNDETLREFLKNPDENVRKQAYEKVYKEYKKFSNIFASTLEGAMKEDVFFSKVRKFNSPLEASVFDDEVKPELFNKILKMANETYHKYFLEYLDIMREVLGKENLYSYDLRLPLVKESNSKYTLDDAFELIFKAVENLGEDYRKIIEKARDERWIDYLPHENKRLGAYSSGCYDTNPYILTSFTQDIESVFTLIHELGHSAHSYLSNNNQEYINSDYRIFVAEVASTVNENLLLNLLIDNAKTKEEKQFLLYKKIDEFQGTCYRQPFFAEYENVLHEKAANNEGLSAKTLTDIYDDLSEKYYGGKVKLHEYSKYSCFGIPHFYYNYYVYKYTIGNCVASVIAKRIYNGDKEQIEKYLNFLKSGSSKSPVELLTLAGVNPLEDNLYKEAFEGFKQDLEEFKKVI